MEKKDFIPIEAAPDPEVCKILENFGLFLGSQDAAVNFPALEANNIQYILNVATGIPNALPEKYEYCNVEILDIEESPIIDSFPKCFSFIEKAFSNNKGILVHCNAGISRSASVVIGYLIHGGMSFQDAFDLVKSKRSKIQPNPGFLKQLKNYGTN